MPFTHTVIKRVIGPACVLLCCSFSEAHSSGDPKKSQRADDSVHYIGLLKKRHGPGAPVYTHGFYFRSEAKKASGLHVAEADKIPPVEDDRKFIKEAPTPKIFVTFDGRTIGDLGLHDDFEAVDLGTNAKKIESKFDWLEKERRPHMLITTSQAKYSDPEGWRVVSLPSSSLKESEIRIQIMDLTTGCQVAKKDTVVDVNADEFKIEKIYTPRHGKRALIKIGSSKCIRWSKIKETSNFEEPHPIWLFKSARGWKRKFGMELVDIGDFDASGKSQALFYAADESTVPAGVAELYGLDSFDMVAETTDQGY